MSAAPPHPIERIVWAHILLFQDGADQAQQEALKRFQSALANLLARLPDFMLKQFEQNDLAPQPGQETRLRDMITAVHDGLYRAETFNPALPKRIALWPVKSGAVKGTPPHEASWIGPDKLKATLTSKDGVNTLGYFEDEIASTTHPVSTPLLSPRTKTVEPRPKLAYFLGVLGSALFLIAMGSAMGTGADIGRAHDRLVNSSAHPDATFRKALDAVCASETAGELGAFCSKKKIEQSELDACLHTAGSEASEESLAGGKTTRACNLIWHHGLASPQDMSSSTDNWLIRASNGVASAVLWLFSMFAQTAVGVANAGSLSLAPYFILTMLSLGLFFVALGFGANGRWCGVLITEQNRLSLALCQVTAWTIGLLSAYAVYAAFNVGALGSFAAFLSADRAKSLFPTMHGWTWAVMGISIATSFASALIKGNKPEDMSEFEKRLAEGNGQVINVTPAPLSQAKASPAEASLADLFYGEDANNDHRLNFSRAQNVIITAVLLFTYLGLIVATMRDISLTRLLEMYSFARPIFQDFPAMSGTFTALIGLTHASYLAGKFQVTSQRID